MLNESFQKRRPFPGEEFARPHVGEELQYGCITQDTEEKLSRWEGLTCSPLRFLKSFSLISEILLFCRSSRIVSSGISSGTSFKPDGKCLDVNFDLGL